MRSTILASLLAVAIASCATRDVQHNKSEPSRGRHRLTAPYSADSGKGLFHLSCTDKYHDGSSHYQSLYLDKSDFGRIDLAKRYFQHAAMASNSYRDPLTKPRFTLPEWKFQEFKSLQSGLAYEIYQKDVGEGLAEIVIAFRGTENSREDWLANLSPVEPRQFKDAVALVKQVRSHNKSARITTTGHSLGGAIALNLSLRLDHVDAVAFNPSPRAFFKSSEGVHNKRVVIYEFGEVLSFVGGKYLEWRLPPGVHYGNYNFMDYLFWTFSPVPEHGIYELTRALTVLAISANSAEAYRFFRSNIDISDAQEYWQYCAYLYN